MPSFGDMLEVVDLLKVSAIRVVEERCVAVRNRNSRCRRCADACIADAIEVGRNEISVDASSCVNCGACVAVCPTEALLAVNPAREESESQARRRADRSSGMAVVACARKAAKRQGDPEKYTEVPCLGHLGETELVSLASSGLDDIVLVDGDCASCRYGATSPLIDEALANAERILDACGAQAIVTRTSEFPPEVSEVQPDDLRGKNRRGLLRQTGSYVKTVAGSVAQKTLEERLGRKSEPHGLQKRLKAGLGGRLPTFEPDRNYRLLDAMHSLGAEGSGSEMRTRHFGNVSIDAEKCSGCGMCVMFCPTAALSYAEFDKPEAEDRRYLEFQAASCTQCMLCRDVCLRYCIEVSPEVSVGELFDFEPQLLEIPRPSNKTSLASLRERYCK